MRVGTEHWEGVRGTYEGAQTPTYDDCGRLRGAVSGVPFRLCSIRTQNLKLSWCFVVTLTDTPVAPCRRCRCFSHGTFASWL